MKFKTTKKAIKQNYSTILSIGYCHAQYLLQFESPIAYSTNSYGHACDYYEIDNICISTGYAPIGKNVDYSILKKYEDEARKIICDYSSASYDVKKQAVQRLLLQFIKEVA